jgi:hypothetical protein
VIVISPQSGDEGYLVLVPSDILLSIPRQASARWLDPLDNYKRLPELENETSVNEILV